MKILCLPNAFKDCLSAGQVAEVMKRAVLSVTQDCEVLKMPLADGGDGLLEAFAAMEKTREVSLEVRDPLGRPVRGSYLLREDQSAVIEMARVCGIRMLSAGERDTRNAGSCGLGLAIADAVKRGCRKLLIGIGGSATTDGGMGALHALGFRFEGIDSDFPAGKHLNSVKRVLDDGVLRELSDCEIRVACDVDNPLLGERGSARVFAPQKGADPKTVEELEEGMKHYADVVESYLGEDFRDMPGAGAAGGMGFALCAMLKGKAVPGAKLILDEAGVDSALEGADLVLTAEGAIDHQSAGGKLPSEVCRRAAKKGIPVFAFAGCLGKGWETLKPAGLTAAFALAPAPVSLEDSLKNAEAYLERAVTEAFAAFMAGAKSRG